jgi:hypothetical protein
MGGKLPASLRTWPSRPNVKVQRTELRPPGPVGPVRVATINPPPQLTAARLTSEDHPWRPLPCPPRARPPSGPMPS